MTRQTTSAEDAQERRQLLEMTHAGKAILAAEDEAQAAEDAAASAAGANLHGRRRDPLLATEESTERRRLLGMTPAGQAALRREDARRQGGTLPAADQGGR